jgi:predicted acetyltransferase
MTITYRTPEADELDAVVAAAELPFGDVVQPADAEFFKEIVERERTIVADDAGRIVGVGAGLSYDLSVPGGDVPMCAVGMISVLPTHRRRGIATALMRQLHAQAAERGEPVTALTASESRIYGRFGYAAATRWADVEIPSVHAALREPVDVAGRVRFVEPAEAADLTLACHAALRATVPGIPGGADSRIRGGFSRDPEHWREGAGARMLVAFEDRGVAAYRIKQDWQPTGPAHTLIISDLVARDDEVLAGLWAYCLSVDLVGTVKAGARPIDDPLSHLLVDPRRLSTTVTDGVWLRLLDVPAALAARRYDADGGWCVEVLDAFGPAGGTYRLDVRDGTATVEAVDDRPDVTLPVDSLAAAYLGDTRLTGLARAGRAAEHRAGALRALDRAFAWDPAPWCPFDF